MRMEGKRNEMREIGGRRVGMGEGMGKREMRREEGEMVGGGVGVGEKVMEGKEGRKLVRRVEVKVEEGGVELVGGRGK